MTKQDQMIDLINDWCNSGKTMNEFCDLHSISTDFLVHWIEKLELPLINDVSKVESGKFLPIKFEHPSESHQTLCIIYPNGVRVELHGSTPKAEIKELIKLY